MKKKTVHRSPFFYMGDKSKLFDQIRGHLPVGIDRLIEPFAGGGSMFMNVEAGEYLLNDLSKWIIKIHQMLNSYRGRKEKFYEEIFKLIRHYGLTSKYFGTCGSNRDGYNRMRKDFNDGGQQDTMLLYMLLIYGFNHMTRFNKKGEFNLPVGNLDFNMNTYNALNDYFEQSVRKHPQWHCQDFRTFLNGIDYAKGDLVYIDPPYLISSYKYNKMWNEDCERDLIGVMDELDGRGVRFAVSNIITYNGRRNEIFGEWAVRYNVHTIKSNYINYHDNSKKALLEVLVTNY